MAKIRKTWNGKPAAVLASGPSLNKRQLKIIQISNIKTIAINTTWEKARFCDVIYGGDYAWWKYNYKDIDIGVEMYTGSDNARIEFGVTYVERPIKPGYNSGLGGAHIAHLKGANPILLCGFDASVDDGIHHHGAHKRTSNPNKKRCLEWVKQAKQFSAQFRETQFINCSIKSELDAFPVRDLSEVLCELGLI